MGVTVARDENATAIKAVAMSSRMRERQTLIKANSSIGEVSGMKSLGTARGMEFCQIAPPESEIQDP